MNLLNIGMLVSVKLFLMYALFEPHISYMLVSYV